MMKKRKPFEVLLKRLREPRRFIQALIGPRQVGKTTLARQVADELERPSRYITADLATLQDISWLQQQWDIARELAKSEGKALLIVDEIQKIPHWSDMVKFRELQDAGNSTTLAHYVDLLAGAGLLTGLQKFANQSVRRKGSSPKFAVYNTALLSAQSGKIFFEAMAYQVFLGRLIESAVGAHLLNSIRGTQIELFYWREGDKEVDFVLQMGDKIIAIEVKSGQEPIRHSGMQSFANQFKPDRILLVGDQGIPLKTFLSTAPSSLFEWNHSLECSWSEKKYQK